MKLGWALFCLAAAFAQTRDPAAWGSDHVGKALPQTGDSGLMLLSKKRADGPEVITSICAQCHLRGGKSGSTGLPYPNQFVAGDNLFRDFRVDFAKADDPTVNDADRHVYRKVRD